MWSELGTGEQGAVYDNPTGTSALTAVRLDTAEGEDRAVPGHWEGDLLAGSKNGHIAMVPSENVTTTAVVPIRIHVENLNLVSHREEDTQV
jgi:hypothetical protein